MKKFIKHFRSYIFRGLLAIIPIGLTYFIIHFLYVTIDLRLAKIIENLSGFSLPGLGIILVLVTLYITGLITSNLVGQKILKIFERIIAKIPLIKSTYQIGKQLSVTLALPEKQVFKRAVLVDYLKDGIYTIGFVTGSVIDTKNNNEKLLKVYIPTPPLPTSGTMVLVRESQTRDPGWTIEEAMRAVISGGIIGPAELK